MDYSRLSMPLGEAIFTAALDPAVPPRPDRCNGRPSDPRSGGESTERRQPTGRAVSRRQRSCHHPGVRDAIPRGVVGEASRRRVRAATRSPPALSCRSRTGRHHGRGTLHCVRVGASKRSGQFCHSCSSEFDARRAGHRDRLGADDAPPICHGSFPRYVRHSRRCRLPFLCAARLSAG